MKVMAIDYGDARTGIAISDPSGTLTGTVLTIHEKNPSVLKNKLCQLVSLHDIKAIVLGYPKNMDGTTGPRAQKSEELAQYIEKETGIKPVLWDERRTTIDASQILIAAGKRGKKRREKLDAVAASLILEGYLAYISD